MLIFQIPWMLLALFPVIAVVVIFVLRRGQTHWRLVHWLLAFSAAFALLAGAGPSFVYNRLSRNINVVIDNSGATRTAFFIHPRRLLRFVARHVPPGTHIHLMSIGNQVRVLHKNSLLHGTVAGSVQFHTSAAHHLNWVALAAAHLARPTWIFTSQFNQWPAQPPVQPAALTIFRPHRPDIGISNLRAHRTADGRVDLGIIIRATGPIRAQLIVRCNSKIIADESIKSKHRGTRVIQLTDGIRPAADWLRYRAQLQSGDPWPMDDHASIVLPPVAADRVLWVSNQPGEAPPIKRVKIIRPDQLPTRTSVLVGYQCVLLHNVAAWNIHPSQAAALAQWVQKDFGGLVMAGASNAFGAGGYGADTTSARLLNGLSPLSSHSPRPVHPGIVFLIDASGSMGRHVSRTGGQTRFELAADGVLGAMHLLGTRIPVHVLVFSGRTLKLRGKNAEQIKSELLRIKPDGSTRPDTALPILRRILHQHDWLILLTDGGIPKMSPLPWQQLLKAHSAHMVIIAGRESRAIRAFVRSSDVKLLLSKSKLRWHALIRNAAMRSQLSPLMHSPLHWLTTPTAGSMIKGVIHEWVHTLIRRRAILLAASRGKHIPLAAYWRVGLGKVAAVAFSGASAADTALLRLVIHRTSASAARQHWRMSLRRIYELPQTVLPDLAAKQSRYRWRLRLWAYRSHDLTRKIKAIVFDRGRQHVISLPMVAPGVYQAFLSSKNHAFYVTLMSAPQPTEKSHRFKLIGRISPLAVPGPWFPATGTPSLPVWPNSTIIDRKASFIWRPNVGIHLALADWLWISAAICGLVAMAIGVVKSSQSGNQS